MSDITITSKKAIFIPDLDNSTTYSIEFYFPPACKLTNTSDAPVRGGYEMLGNKIDITFTSPESINISGIVNDDMIIGQCKIETRIQRNFICVFYYKRNYGELKANICLLFNILNKKSGHINLISPAIIEKWISQFADSNQKLVLTETYKILDEYRSMIRKTISKKSVTSFIKSLFKKDPHLERLKEFIGDPELLKINPKLFVGKLFFINSELAETIRLNEEYKVTSELQKMKEVKLKSENSFKKNADDNEFQDVFETLNSRNIDHVNPYGSSFCRSDLPIESEDAVNIDDFFFGDTDIDSNYFEESPPFEKHKEEFKYYYYYKYYPTRFNVSEEYQKIRYMIWEFKDGKNSHQTANTLASDIKKINLSDPLSSWWLCIIPASTKEKTERRFKHFCETFSNQTRLKNGFMLITSKFDRNAAHLSEDRNTVEILDAIDFVSINGKKILLFDDIYTTGKSFLKVARKLKTLGALEVVGLFMGKTHWIDQNENL